MEYENKNGGIRPGVYESMQYTLKTRQLVQICGSKFYLFICLFIIYL